MEKTLTKLLKQYPEVSYEGYIAYHWSDVHCGEAEQWSLSSGEKVKEDKVFDFIGESLAKAMHSDFWDEMAENLEDGDVDDFKQILANLYAYKKWLPEDTFDNLFELADEVDEDVRQELEEALEELENGDGIEIKKDEIDESNLPEGYMDVLNAVIQSEDARKKAEIEAELAEEE